MPIRVLIADDHPVVRDGLRLAIERRGGEVKVVGEAVDGMELLKAAEKTCADVCIVDITMPRLNGIEATRELLRRHPSAKVIVLSLHDTKVMVEEAMKAGARGFLTKEAATRNVVDAVSEVHAGRFYLSPAVAHYAVEAMAAGKRVARRRGDLATSLTGQERKVLQLITEGHSNKEIAALLGLSPNTVHAHRNRAMAKLGIHKHADLVRFAIREGIAKL